MSMPYVGEIRIFGFQRVPTGWFACDGSLKPISEYETLYALLGTTYGGNGAQTFGVPDLRGQVPLHQGRGLGLTTRVLGESGGSETVALTVGTMPGHLHPVMVTTAAATTATPANGLVPASLGTGDTFYVSNLAGASTVALAPAGVSSIGGNTPHENTMPTLTLSICIAWQGIYPSQN